MGLLEQVAITELAASMKRMYGASQAVDWAGRYAAEAASVNDVLMHARWAAVAALLGEVIDRGSRAR